jgi:hypothetical protein
LPENATLTNSSFPEYLSFEKLRTAGLTHLEDLGAELWTDFNIHDPGITILEILCYALTDLGYRANLPVEDLLAPNPDEKRGGEDDNFFTARQILTCNPVTVRDFRRLLIDTPGVKNAWLELTDESEIPIYVNPERCELQYEIPRTFSATTEAGEARLPLGGLYNVCLEIEPDEDVDACGQVSHSARHVLNRVRSVLHQHRNLCEDFRDFIVLGDEEIAVCAGIELTSEADPEEVLLSIYQKVQGFLSPDLQFYSLQEMLGTGKRIEDIFAGRPMRQQSHGFLDQKELDKTELRSALYVSDLYQVIMDVPGVKAIDKLVVTNYVHDIAQTQGEEWCLKLTPKHRPVLDIERSRINFFKESLPFGVNRDRVQQEYRDLREASTKAFRSAYELDLPVPTGFHRDIADYRSTQHEFPLVYGLGESGPDLSGLDRQERLRRIAQARQLKGFLLFFDQILANYLTQLAHVRDLFSMQSDDHPARAGKTHTYFTQLLADVPNIEDLIRSVDTASNPSGSSETGKLEDFAAYVARIAESPETYYERRNRFLDHLLARFAESFSDYVLLMYRLNGERHDNEKIVDDKTRFLQSYPNVSRDRGKAFDYTNPEVWETTNVSGLEERVSRLVGIEDVTRRFLAHCEVVTVAGRYRFRIARDGEVLAISASAYPDQTSAAEALERFIQRGRHERNYRRLAYDGFDHYGFGIVDDEGTVIAEYPHLFPEPEERASARQSFRRRLAEDGPAALEVVRKGGRYYFQITVETGGPVILGREGFREEVEADHGAEQFLEWAVNDTHYEELTVHGFTHYGFVLMDEGGDPLMESPRLWESRAARDAVLLSLIGYVHEPAVNCSVVRADECYFYVVYDAAYDAGEDDPGEHTLFTAEEGYSSAAEAEDAFEDTFLSLAGDILNYEGTDTEGGFAFVLRDPETDSIVAEHTRAYNTVQERDDRLHAAVLYLADVPIDYETPGEEGVFRYKIRDVDDTVQLQSSGTYPTESKAEGACRAAMRLARYRIYYRTLDDLGADAPQGFELIDREGNVVAEHPRGYETDGARDEALDKLIESAEKADEGPLTCFVDGTPGSFAFELYLEEEGGSRRLLFESVDTYPEKTLAEEAYHSFLQLAREREYYFMEDNFSFALRERDEEGTWGPLVATHPQLYVSDLERDAAIELIRTYVRDDPIVHEVVNTEGSYYFELTDPSDEILLEGVESFPTVEEAEEAFEGFLEVAADLLRYQVTTDGPDSCPHGFELRAVPTAGEKETEEEQGRLVATHPRTYTTAEARDDRIDEVAGFAAEESPAYQIKGTTCGYYYVQESGGHRFRSIQRFPHEARAVRACMAKTSLLADEERYSRPEEDTWADRLVITDSGGSVVAVYTGPAESSEDLAAVFGEVTAAIAASPDVEATYDWRPSGFRVQFMDREGQGVLLRGQRVRTPVVALSPANLFDDPEARDGTVQYLVDLTSGAVPEPEIVRRDESFYFTLMKNDTTVLISCRGYETEREARQAFEAFVAVGDDPESYHAFDLEADGRYGFEVYDPVSADQLRETVCTDCNRIVERAQNPEHFRWIADRSDCLFGFELVTDASRTLAVHDRFYGSETVRKDRVEEIIDLVNDEGFHLVENLLVRPRRPGSSIIDDEGDAFLPLSEGCLDEEGRISFLKSDPYSFRATVVLPYWPDRFQNLSFRSFFERTLRAEAPAHVYLRICWVDACQMHDFEQAYRRWLQTLALPEHDCESTEALNRLLEVICRLRNVYPEATLGACDAAAPGARVVLNQTLLGTANPDRDDNS